MARQLGLWLVLLFSGCGTEDEPEGASDRNAGRFAAGNYDQSSGLTVVNSGVNLVEHNKQRHGEV